MFCPWLQPAALVKRQVNEPPFRLALHLVSSFQLAFDHCLHLQCLNNFCEMFAIHRRLYIECLPEDLALASLQLCRKPAKQPGSTSQPMASLYCTKLKYLKYIFKYKFFLWLTCGFAWQLSACLLSDINTCRAPILMWRFINTGRSPESSYNCHFCG